MRILKRIIYHQLIKLVIRFLIAKTSQAYLAYKWRLLKSQNDGLSFVIKHGSQLSSTMSWTSCNRARFVAEKRYVNLRDFTYLYMHKLVGLIIIIITIKRQIPYSLSGFHYLFFAVVLNMSTLSSLPLDAHFALSLSSSPPVGLGTFLISGLIRVCINDKNKWCVTEMNACMAVGNAY